MSAILADQQQAVLRLQFNRPERKNAFTAAMYDAVADALRSAESDRSIRVVLLHGAGDAFTSGNDLHDFLERPPQSLDSPVFRFMSSLAGFSKPVVAAVNGTAVGIGTTLLLHCDLAYAAEGARFQLPFVNLGLVPEFGSSLLLPAMMGHRRAAELLLLAAPFDARTAADLGLINQVVPHDAVLSTASAAAMAVARQPAAAVRATKALLKRSVMPALESALRDEARVFAERLVSPEAKEAFTAFFGKRVPDFSSFD